MAVNCLTISPKAPKTIQDQFLGVFANHGRRNTKLLMLIFVEIYIFFESPVFYIILSILPFSIRIFQTQTHTHTQLKQIPHPTPPQMAFSEI